jgi:hypothetical protein
VYEKKVYNPGFIDCYQKPWFKAEWGGHIRYCGQFCEPGYDRVRLSFDPIRKLAEEITDPILKDKMLDLIEEMNDAHYALEDQHRDNIPGCMWD